MTVTAMKHLEPGDRVSIFPGTDDAATGTVADVRPLNVRIIWDDGVESWISIYGGEHLVRAGGA